MFLFTFLKLLIDGNILENKVGPFVTPLCYWFNLWHWSHIVNFFWIPYFQLLFYILYLLFSAPVVFWSWHLRPTCHVGQVHLQAGVPRKRLRDTRSSVGCQQQRWEGASRNAVFKDVGNTTQLWDRNRGSF